MHQEILHIHLPFDFPILGRDIPIYSYGLMLVIGFLAATQLAKFLARRKGLDGEIFVNAALLALVAGVVGARLSHILENLGPGGEFDLAKHSIGDSFGNMLNLRNGGLTFYGGFLLAGPVLAIYAWKKKVPLRLGMDIVAPCLMVGLGFGRIGCFLNGCCYGSQCELPWSVQFPYYSNAYQEEFEKNEVRPNPELLKLTPKGGTSLRKPDDIRNDDHLKALANMERSLPVQPAQLYSAFNAFLLVVLLTAFFTLPHAAGRVFALMLVLEGATRFLLELLRVEPGIALKGVHLRPEPGLSLSMLLGAGFVVAGIVLWWLFGKMRDGRQGTIGAQGMRN